MMHKHKVYHCLCRFMCVCSVSTSRAITISDCVMNLATDICISVCDFQLKCAQARAIFNFSLLPCPTVSTTLHFSCCVISHYLPRLLLTNFHKLSWITFSIFMIIPAFHEVAAIKIDCLLTSSEMKKPLRACELNIYVYMITFTAVPWK
jgi:hypothetical protein